MSVSKTARKASAAAEKPLGRVYDRQLVSRLLAYLKPYGGYVVVSIILLTLHSLLGVSGPYLTKVAVDRYLQPNEQATSFLDPYLPDDPFDGIIRIVLIYLGIILFGSVARSSQIYVMNLTGQRAMYDLRTQIFAHLQRLSVPHFDKNPIGRVVTRVTTDVDVLNELFTSGVVAIAGDLLTLVFSFVIMFLLSPGLTLALISIAPFAMIVSFLFRKSARAGFRETRVAVAKINSFLQESFSGISEIQVFSHEQAALENFTQINDEHRLANYRAIRAHAIFYPTIELLGVVGIALLVLFGGKWVVEGSLTIGVVLAFMQYGMRVFRPIQDLAEKYNVLQAAMAGAERIFQLLDTQPSTAESAAGDSVANKDLRIEFSNVWFAYNDEDWVLRDVSFSVEQGEMLAVVGHTGAGKTTLISLILRFYEIQKGSITVGGRDIREWPIDQLRKQFAVVLQDPYLFAGSIGDNIGLNQAEVADKAVREAAGHAHLAKYIESLPATYD